MQAIYDHKYFDTTLAHDGAMGDLWGAIGQIGASGVQLIPYFLQPGGASGGSIAALTSQAIASLNSLLDQVHHGTVTIDAALPEGQRIQAALSNPQYVRQPSNNKDRNVLNTAQRDAATIVAELQRLYGIWGIPNGTIWQTRAPASSTGNAPTPAVTNPAAPTPAVVPAAAASTGGLDNTTVLFVAGGILAAVLLTR